MIVDKILQFLSGEGKPIDKKILADVSEMAGWSFDRQFGIREKKSTTGKLRLSSIGKCLRAQAYSLLGFEENGKELDARSRTVFFMGDLTELAVVALARAAGCLIQVAGRDQKTVQVDGIEGHPDGIYVDGDDVYLLEVKSMSSFAFKELERGLLDEGYRYQINAYLEALGLSKCVVVALHKDAGVLGEMVISKDETIVADIKARIALLKQATKEDLPERPYKPHEKTGFYPWNCLYCAWWKTCLPTAEKVLVSNKYKLKEIEKNETTSATKD